MRTVQISLASVALMLGAAGIAKSSVARPLTAHEARSYTIVTERGFATRLGPWRLRNATLARAIEVFGAPSSQVHPSGYREACRVAWRDRHIKATFANFGGADGCDPASGLLMRFTVRSSAWRTAAGLRVGNRTSRITEFYPSAAIEHGLWTLLSRDFGLGTPGPIPTVSATPRNGRVRALTAYVYAAGD